MTVRNTHEVALVAVSGGLGPTDGEGVLASQLAALVAASGGTDGAGQGIHATHLTALAAATLGEGSIEGIHLTHLVAMAAHHIGPVLDWIMDFKEIRFPTDISAGSQGAPRFNTESVDVDSGHRQTLQRWAMELQRFNVAYGVTSMEKLERLHAFFRVVGGRASGFRYKDHLDFNSTGYDGVNIRATSALDQVIAELDGTTTEFQLIKTYEYGGQTYVRNIVKPVAGTVKVAIAGVELTEGIEWSVDTTTGIISLIGSPIQGGGPGSPFAYLTAGYEFDVPCQFMVDHLPTTLTTYGVGTSLNIGVEEIRIT